MFGARTGGAMLIIGAILIFLGAFYGKALMQILSLFPFSILGVLLLFAGLELAMTVRDITAKESELFVALFSAAICIGLKYGYVVALIGGTLLAHAIGRKLITFESAMTF